VFTSARERFGLNAILLTPSIPHAPGYLLAKATQNGKPVWPTSSAAPRSRSAGTESSGSVEIATRYLDIASKGARMAPRTENFLTRARSIALACAGICPDDQNQLVRTMRLGRSALTE